MKNLLSKLTAFGAVFILCMCICFMFSSAYASGVKVTHKIEKMHVNVKAVSYGYTVSHSTLMPVRCTVSIMKTLSFTSAGEIHINRVQTLIAYHFYKRPINDEKPDNKNYQLIRKDNLNLNSCMLDC